MLLRVADDKDRSEWATGLLALGEDGAAVWETSTAMGVVDSADANKEKRVGEDCELDKNSVVNQPDTS